MRDKFGNIIRTDFDKPALARTVTSSISSDTAITFNTATKVIRVFASSKDIYLKWGTDVCAVNTFDEIIPAGLYLDLAIPLDSSGVPYTGCHVVERAASATLVLIEK
jgi:hypothetical protein